MTSSNSTHSSPIPKVRNMSGMKSLVGKRNTKIVKFLEQDLTISKLSLADVTEIQQMSRDRAEDEANGLDVIRTVLRKGAEGAGDLTNDELDTFPLDDLNLLSKQILEFSGLGNAGAEVGE